MDRRLSPVLPGVLAAILVGCAEPAPVLPGAAPPAPEASSQASPGVNPLTKSELKRERRRVTGHVEERVQAGSYTYLAVRLPDDTRHWVVTMGAGQPEGVEVDVNSMGEQTNFYSRRLDRTFDRVLFAVVRPMK